MSDQLIPVSEAWAKRAFVDNAKYLDLYKASVADPATFWREQGKRIDWIKPYTKVKDVSYDASNLHIRWYEDGALNVSAKSRFAFRLDRHDARSSPRQQIDHHSDLAPLDRVRGRG